MTGANVLNANEPNDDNKSLKHDCKHELEPDVDDDLLTLRSIEVLPSSLSR